MPRRWIVLSFEGLSNLALGPYGSSWNATPRFDRLAATGVTWDRVIIPNEDVAETLRRFWESPLGNRTWIEAWREQGPVELLLPRDAESPPIEAARSGSAEADVEGGARKVSPSSTPKLAETALGLGFDACTLIDLEPRQAVCQEVDATGLGQTFAALIDRIGSPEIDGVEPEDWSVLWVHSDLLTRCWDAPHWLFPIDDDDQDTEPDDPAGDYLSESGAADRAAAERNAADAPPPLLPGLLPPAIRLGPTDHPDWTTSWMQTYGCQVRLLDYWLGLLADLIAQDPRDIGLAVLGTSGFSLGQDGWVGHRVGPIRSPQIQVPAILHWAGVAGHADWAPLRWPALEPLERLASWLVPVPPSVSVTSAYPSPEAWARAATPGEASVQTISSRASHVITTSEWFLVRQGDSPAQLFLKPDDRDDINDIADRCPDIVAELSRSAEGTSFADPANGNGFG